MDKIAKHIRIYITENCNARCKNCFNSSSRTNAEMSVERFSMLCKYLRSNGIEHIKIMGGEPTIHPNFLEIVRIAQEYFKEVSIFTNAINGNIVKIHPRETDSIIYNFKFSKALDEEKILLNRKGKRALEVQVQKDSDIKKIKSELNRIVRIMPGINVDLTLDCTADIFEEREYVVPRYEDLQNYCKLHDIAQSQDHILPLCYVRGSNIPLPKIAAICSPYCAGLIDAKYNLKYCNQHPEILINMFAEKEEIISWKKVIDLLQETNDGLRRELKDSVCKGCPFWNIYCNGGCFMKKINE